MLRDLFSLFPAYAGVIPFHGLSTFLSTPFPRIRGGDPRHGCRSYQAACLFPAYAGVIPPRLGRSVQDRPFPRIRGGDPVLVSPTTGLVLFSPHTRG